MFLFHALSVSRFAEAKRGDFAAQFRSLTGLAADVEVTVAFTPVTSSSGRRLSAAATELAVAPEQQSSV